MAKKGEIKSDLKKEDLEGKIDSKEVEKFDSGKDSNVPNDDDIMKVKKRHNVDKVYVIIVEDKVCYIKHPPRSALSKIIMMLGEKDILGAGDMIMNECWLQGDKEMLEDDEYNVSASFKAVEVVQIKTSQMLKK